MARWLQVVELAMTEKEIGSLQPFSAREAANRVERAIVRRSNAASSVRLLMARWRPR